MFYDRQFLFNAEACWIVAVCALLSWSSVSAQNMSFDLTGEVLDQQNAAIVTAKVILIDSSGNERKPASNSKGVFRFRELPYGRFRLKVSADGFAPYEAEFEQTHPAMMKPLKIVLFPTVQEEVSVVRTDERLLAPANAAGVLTLNERDLANLSDDPEQLSQQLQQMAASGGGIPGQATVTVDGFLHDGRLPSRSSISQVRINPNLYSAEFDTPPFRGGRIEIVTKPGSESFHGSGFVDINDSDLNARDTFSVVRADQSIRRYGLNFGAPIIKQRSSFFLDVEKRDIDQAQIVNAIVLNEDLQPSNFVFNSPNPQRLIRGTVRGDWQANQNNVLILRLDSGRTNLNGQGIGGINLPERGFDLAQTESNLRISENYALSPKAVNEFRFGLTHRTIDQRSVSNEPAIVVAGSFISGGADTRRLRRKERLLEIADNLTYDTGGHSLKFGVQIFRRDFDELRAENTHGSFFFGGGTLGTAGNQTDISSIDLYRRTLLGLPGGLPTRFTLTVGSPRVLIDQWLLAGYVQHEWRLDPKVLLSLGFRYEAQTSPTDRMGFAPRVSIAYTPDAKQRWVLRGRAGVFYERIAENVLLETRRLDGVRQQQLIIDSPSFPDPFIDGTQAVTHQTIRTIDPNIRPPASLQLRLEIERQLPKGWKISASHSWTKGWSQLRSRNINAPIISAADPDPQSAPRPFGQVGNILQFESSGQLKGRVLYVGVNQNSLRLFSINAGYLNFDFRTDADGAFLLPQSSYDLEGEWAPPAWQSRHVTFVSASTDLPWNLRLFASFNASSGRPFNVTTGRDNNGDGNFNDRPSFSLAGDPSAIITRFGPMNGNVINGDVPRNVGTHPWSATLNLNLSRTFSFGKNDTNGERPFRLTGSIRSSNVLNRSNLSNVSSVLTSPQFGIATTAGPARRIELGLRFNF